MHNDWARLNKNTFKELSTYSMLKVLIKVSLEVL